MFLEEWAPLGGAGESDPERPVAEGRVSDEGGAEGGGNCCILGGWVQGAPVATPGDV